MPFGVSAMIGASGGHDIAARSIRFVRGYARSALLCKLLSDTSTELDEGGRQTYSKGALTHILEGMLRSSRHRGERGRAREVSFRENARLCAKTQTQCTVAA